jgi:hypothetical protein
MGVRERPEERHHPLMPSSLWWRWAAPRPTPWELEEEEEEEKNVQRGNGAFHIGREGQCTQYNTPLSQCCKVQTKSGREREGKLSRVLVQRPTLICTGCMDGCTTRQEYFFSHFFMGKVC